MTFIVVIYICFLPLSILGFTIVAGLLNELNINALLFFLVNVRTSVLSFTHALVCMRSIYFGNKMCWIPLNIYIFPQVGEEVFINFLGDAIQFS